MANELASGAPAVGPLVASSLYGARGFLFTMDALFAVACGVAALVAAAALLHSPLLRCLRRRQREPAPGASSTREGLGRPFLREDG